MSFYEKGDLVPLSFWPKYYFNGLILAVRNNIVAKKTTELVLLFHEKTTKLVFFTLAEYDPKRHQSVKKVFNHILSYSFFLFSIFRLSEKHESYVR